MNSHKTATDAGLGRGFFKYSDNSIWWFAFGYFACYVPYSALTKVFSDGLLPGMTHSINGFVLLPITAIAAMVAGYIFISLKGWWKYARHINIFGLSLPFPGGWTFLSGICSAAIIPTTTLAYTFTGISIVFMMLLMRGGVLIIAPITDYLSGRKVQHRSWVALILALGALFVGCSGKSYTMTFAAIFNVALYLLAYFIRLRFMSRIAKSDDQKMMTRYFVEEQMTSTPALIFFLILLAVFGPAGAVATEATRSGFDILSTTSVSIVLVAVLIGVLSQGTGIFGGLILLDRRENTFCVPLNRASSVLAGIVATLGLWYIFDKRPPALSEFVGAGMIVLAIVVLSLPKKWFSRKNKNVQPLVDPKPVIVK